MKRLLTMLSVALLTATGTLLITPAALAADSPAAPAEKQTAKPKARPIAGKVEAIDSTAKTITLSGEKKQVLQVTSETKIQKAGKPATFADIPVGESIGGSVVDQDGKLVLRSLRVGPKPESDQPAKKKKEKEKEKGAAK